MSVMTFRGSARPSLGVELEFQLLNDRTLALTGASEVVLASVLAEFQGSVKPEFYDSCVEVNTGVCRDVAEVGRDLGPKLAATARAAGRHSVLLGWGGTHPFSHWRDQPVVPTSRYRALAEFYRETLCRQVTFGLHVHLGVAHGDTAVRVCNRIVEHLPVLLALSANSPFWCGRATGLQSHRAEVMAPSPSSGPPPRLGGWDDYAALVERLISAGLIATAKDLWWDVRPNSEHGTVEVRVCDMPPDLSAVLGLTALVQCLVVALAREDGDGNGDGDGDRPDLDECGRMIVRQNQWRAARFGLGAELIDPRTGRCATAREVAKDLAARFVGLAKALGCVAELGLVRVMADGPSGAERQLAVFERTGDLTEVVRREMIEPASAVWARNEREWPRADGRAAVTGSWPARGVCWPDGIKRPVRWRLVRSSPR